MSVRPVATEDVGEALYTASRAPYFNSSRHLTPTKYADFDGGAHGPLFARPTYTPVREKWVIAPQLGSSEPAICVFPRRLSTNVTLAPDINLSFSQVWHPNIVRFKDLILTDVDKKGNMPERGQAQHWLITWKGKTATGLTSVVIRVRVNNSGDSLEGWAIYLPDQDFVQSFSDFPAPPASAVGFDSSTAVVVNGAFTGIQASDVPIQFSELDRNVEFAMRRQRASDAWKLFTRDVAMRSKNTVATINQIRLTTYNRYFQGREQHRDWWVVDVERPPGRSYLE